MAQVKGRNNISWDEKVMYDNMYVDMFQKQGIWLDFKILLQTVTNVFKHEDIYEQKEDGSLSDADAAKQAEEEIIRIAHLPDEEEELVMK